MKQFVLRQAIAAERQHSFVQSTCRRSCGLPINTISRQILRLITPHTGPVVGKRPLISPIRSAPSTRRYGPRIFASSASSSSPAEPPTPPSDDEAPVTEVMGKTFSFEDVVYTINILYFSILLASIFTGNRHLTNIASFANFVTAMFLASAAFTGWSATRWITDIRENLAEAQRRRDFRALLRFGWSAVFWLGFVMWYAVPPMETLTQWTGTAGAICCLYGIALAGSSAVMVGSWSFLGPPSTPKRLVTGGPYALLRHPQALGNFLAVIGFSLSGGAIAAALVFALSFWMYCYTNVPKEEKMLEKAFGAKYRHYAERVPAFGWALWLLLILEAVLIWRYGIRSGVPVVTMGAIVI